MNDNNLTAVRFFSAMLVLYGHAFVFLGLKEPLFLSWIHLGPLGVYIFFTISGYLITASWNKDPHLFRYLYRRCLRIFPGLAVCLILSIIILGPLVSSKTIHEYFSNPATWNYFTTNVVLYITYYLPGIFENNHLPNAVNGSLWSLPVEFTMYLVIALLGVLSRNKWIYLILAILSGLATYVWAWKTKEMVVIYGYDLRQAFICGTYFWVGATFYSFNIKKYFSSTLTVILIIALLCIAPWPHLLNILAWFIIPFIVLSFGFSHHPVISKITSTGDYSYGIYIYAFPIQQTIASFWPNIQIFPYIAISTIITIVFAILSWHLVESRALALKPKKLIT